jgi:5-oxoprolinase (ATP-hydrolysing)
MNPWLISIDTGGTFTDCIAESPEGKVHYLKILSSSVLRGNIVKKIDPYTYAIEFPWSVSRDIFKDFQFRFTQSNIYYRVKSINMEKGLLFLHESPTQESGTFEITSGEEVPVLAARLLTLTPINQAFPPLRMRLGSTKGTNALLERKGARTALLTTQGFADLPHIGTQQRPHLFSLHIQKPIPLHQFSWEVSGRLDAQGQALSEINNEEIQAIARQLNDHEVESVAIACMHSYKNSRHEEAIAQVLQQEGFGFVSCSAHLSQSIKFWPRMQTALVNAYLAPLLSRYLTGIAKVLPEGSLRIMTSAGGLADFRHFHPKDSLLSGPAGGMVGAAFKATEAGFQRIITLDMGGTSADVALFNGRLDYRFETRVGDADIQSPALAINTIAAGGGSICGVDAFGKCFVGPESAGASPGPAAYGAGGPLTLTDINLLAGHAVAHSYHIPIHLTESKRTFLKVFDQIPGTTPQDLLHSYLQIANEKMAEAIRKISVKKGFNPQEYVLLAFGGAGGQHACGVASLLGMRQIQVPYEAGLLSAYGIRRARPEAIAEEQVLGPWEIHHKELKGKIEHLAQAARNELINQGESDLSLNMKWVTLRLRLKGQEDTLEIDWQEGLEVEEAFHQEYHRIYGHPAPNRPMEWESIRVLVVSEQKIKSYNPPPLQPSKPQPDLWTEPAFGGQKIPVYRWEKLSPGARFSGPALLVSANGTTVVEEGWHLLLDGYSNALITPTESQHQDETTLESAALELFKNRFSAIAEEMGAILQRTAFSVNVKERLDFSCALLDANGMLVANAPHIPVHLGSLGICTRLVTKALTLGPGDVAITNHPGYGGSHLPDITLISGVFDTQGGLLGYVANRAHHAEMGGKRPGSMPPEATNLEEEGVVLPPQYLVKGGVILWDSIKNQLESGPYPSRAPEENLADLRGALASIFTGVAGLQQLVENFGHERVQYYMNRLQEYARERLKEAISPWQGKTSHAEEPLDDGSVLKVAIEVKKEGIVFDFTGTSPVHPGNFNANRAITTSAVLYVLRLVVNEDLPLNEGLMREVELKIPMGCMLNPIFQGAPSECPAVVGGNTETSQRLVDTLLKAFGLSACSQGTMNNVLFGNPTFGYYETIGGGTGAGPGFAGASGVHQHMTNTRITDPEVMELRYPVRVHQFGLRKSSGGNGKFSGGEGIVRELEFLEPVELTVLAQHRTVEPYGMQGGENGKVGQQLVIRKNGETLSLSGTESLEIGSGDKFRIETPGGGGWGSVE